jgi:excinuclease ABC subunit A
VGTVTTLSNSLRMLFSRAGTYPSGAAQLDSDAFSPNTAAGACQECHGLGVAHTVSEKSLVPDTGLTIREGAIAAWPGAWQGKNLRDILSHLGHDVDIPWRKLPKKDRDWILFTEDQPVVEVTPERDRVAKPYKGRFWSARSYVLHTLADSQSAAMRERVLAFMESGPCPRCGGTGLRPEALDVSFAGRTIAELNATPMAELAEIIRPTAGLKDAGTASRRQSSGEENEVAVAITADLLQRITVLLDLGLGYL